MIKSLMTISLLLSASTSYAAKDFFLVETYPHKIGYAALQESDASLLLSGVPARQLFIKGTLDQQIEQDGFIYERRIVGQFVCTKRSAQSASAIASEVAGSLASPVINITAGGTFNCKTKIAY